MAPSQQHDILPAELINSSIDCIGTSLEGERLGHALSRISLKVFECGHRWNSLTRGVAKVNVLFRRWSGKYEVSTGGKGAVIAHRSLFFRMRGPLVNAEGLPLFCNPGLF